jgi:hypothetical protein
LDVKAGKSFLICCPFVSLITPIKINQMKKVILGLFLICAISIGASAQTTKPKTQPATHPTTTQPATKEKTAEKSKTDAKSHEATAAQHSSVATAPKHKKHKSHKSTTKTSTK